MNHSASQATQSVTSGVVAERRGGEITLAHPGSSYRLDLRLDEPEQGGVAVGARVRGEIRVQAARIDVIKTGGKYIEPVDGPPRRVAGRVLETDRYANIVIVDAGPFVVVCTPNAHQKASDFAVDQLVTMGVKPGATFKVTG